MIVIGILLIVLVLFFVVCYNRLRRLGVKVEESSSGIDVALEKRYDLLSEELEAVKKFLQHEYETYTAVAAARAGTEMEEKRREAQGRLTEEMLKEMEREVTRQTEAMEQIAGKMGEARQEQDGQKDAPQPGAQESRMDRLTHIHHSLGSVKSAVDALSEQYPVLYSAASMEHFQRDILNTEEHLQAARRLYNANASLYNQTLASIPYVLFAGICGMKRAAFYEVEEKKKEVRISFDK